MSRNQPSAPFASRELNGEVLLSELEELRSAQVQQRHLIDCVLSLRELPQTRMTEAAARLKQLAANRFAGQPALASLLVRWAQRLRSEADLPLLLIHLEQLALTSAIIGALRRATERLPRGGQG
jgi:hypothetical protein